jgi:hypothetical protein
LHFVAPMRLVASDVSKVVDSRTRVKSYFKLFWRKGNEVYKSLIYLSRTRNKS